MNRRGYVLIVCYIDQYFVTLCTNLNILIQHKLEGVIQCLAIGLVFVADMVTLLSDSDDNTVLRGLAAQFSRYHTE